MAKLNYNEYGEGEPLIVMHGLFGSARNWNTVARQLARDFRIIAVDLRNHGESDHAPGMTYPDMVDDIERLLDRLELPGAVLLGHSMGGKAAMAFALTHPDRTRGLIVVDIAPADYHGRNLELISAMQSLPLSELSSRADADARLEAAGVPDPLIRQFLLQNLVRKDGAYTWRLNLEVLRRHMDELTSFPREWPHASYNGPACFLAGAHSDFVQPQHHAEIHRLFPSAEIKIIDNANHWVHADRPEAVIEAVRGFLGEASGIRPGTNRD